MEKRISSRDPALDLVRCTALFLVVSTHFFHYSGYYLGPVKGALMYGMTLLRTLSMVCVPLFILLSGYLMSDRTISADYFRKLSRTLMVYVLASIACAIYRNAANNNPMTFKQVIRGILDFTTASYAWYIEMYIGLFLMIPFLNVLYRNLESQKQKQLLLGVLLFCTMMPSVANIWCILEPEWWLKPTISTNYYELVPNWWTELYPITYYFIGCYLREYPLKRKRSVNLGLLAASALAAGSFAYYRSYDYWFVFGIWQDYGSVSNVVLAVLIFSVLSGLDLHGISDRAKTWLTRCSDWSLAAYLVSWIFDESFYELLETYVPVMQDRLVWYPVIVPVIYICSLLLAAPIHILSGWLLRMMRKLPVKYPARKQ